MQLFFAFPAILRKRQKRPYAFTYGLLAAELGFEPRQTESESVVLPLHNSAIYHFPGPVRRDNGINYNDFSPNVNRHAEKFENIFFRFPLAF